MIKLNKIIFLSLFVSSLLLGSKSMADDKRDKIQMTLKDGVVLIETRPDVAPKHVDQIKKLISEGQYDGVVFHRVIEGFMAQTGDVKFGNINNFNKDLVGTGSSDLPDLKAEFNNIPHERGTVSMARSSNPDSGNSQFFICFKAAPHLDRQYTVFGKVTRGMEFIDQIKRGEPGSGSVSSPDYIESIKIK